MASGWTCARCAAQNDEISVACQTCGLIRGAAFAAPGTSQAAPAPPPSPSPDAASSAPPPPADWSGAGAPQPPSAGVAAPGGWPGVPIASSPASPKKGLLVGCLANIGIRIILVLVVAGVIGGIAWFNTAGRDSNGNITKSGELQPSDLKIGDCWDLPGGGSSFDPNATIDKTTAMKCTDAHRYEVFYTGTMTDNGSYPTSDDFSAFAVTNCGPAFKTYVGTPYDQSSLTFYYFYPATDAWSSGNRDFQCSLADANLKVLSKSLKGSGY
jgi:hypothetical protein